MAAMLRPNGAPSKRTAGARRTAARHSRAPAAYAIFARSLQSEVTSRARAACRGSSRSKTLG